MKPHKHAALIKAWADGAEIEYRLDETWPWSTTNNPNWDYAGEFRIKQNPKPDLKYAFFVSREPFSLSGVNFKHMLIFTKGDLLITFDGETGKLKAAEVLK